MAFRAAAPTITKESAEVGFELLGFDFMVDADLNVSLIEVNQNPCLATLCERQKVLITNLVADTLALTVDPLFGLTHTDTNNKFKLNLPLKHDKLEAEFQTRYELVHVHTEELV